MVTSALPMGLNHLTFIPCSLSQYDSPSKPQDIFPADILTFWASPSLSLFSIVIPWRYTTSQFYIFLNGSWFSISFLTMPAYGYPFDSFISDIINYKPLLTSSLIPPPVELIAQLRRVIIRGMLASGVFLSLHS